MKCQLCNNEIEGELSNKLEHIYAMPHYGLMLALNLMAV